MDKVTPFLWFDDQAEAAVEFYVSLFPNSRIVRVSRYGDSGPGTPGRVMTIAFELDGRSFMALNGGPLFKFTEAMSLTVDCEDQAETDRLWQGLTEGGEESRCGWLKDRWGVSWQIIPKALPQLLAHDDAATRNRVMQAMLGMRKIDVEALRRAAA